MVDFLVCRIFLIPFARLLFFLHLLVIHRFVGRCVCDIQTLITWLVDGYYGYSSQQQQVSTVTAKLMNGVLGNVLNLIRNNIGAPHAPWMNRIASMLLLSSLYLLLLFCIDRAMTRPIITDVPWSVCLCLSVSLYGCLFVTSVSLAKPDEPIETPSGMWTRNLPRSHVQLGPRSLHPKGYFSRSGGNI